MKVFISWSGGKESVFSCYKVMQKKGVEVKYLLNMLTEDGKHSCSHGIRSNLLRAQAEALAIPIVQKNTTSETYEREFKDAILEFKKEDISAGVFGDIDFPPHRDWVERVCKESGAKALLPLWEKTREEILDGFISAGFETIVIAVKTDMLGQDWLGRKLDRAFMKDIKKLKTVDPCGEAGEYHTFVTSGPIFKKKINILNVKKINKDEHWFLDILDYEIIEKN